MTTDPESMRAGPRQGAPSEHIEAPRVVRDSSFTALAAALGVASGLLVDIAIVATFGAGSATDAFFVAARLPLATVTILMVGAGQALVPAFSTWAVQRDRRDADCSISHVLTMIVCGGIFTGLLLVLTAVPLVAVLAPGLPAATAAHAVGLLRTLAILVPLLAVAEVLRAVLNARRSFAAPAGMNLLMNLVVVGVILGTAHQDVRRLAHAFVLGALVKVAYLAVLAHRRGFSFRPTFRSTDAVSALRLCVKPAGAAGLSPVARIAEQALASFLPAGSISILNYAHRLVWAIGGTVFFRSIVSTIVPRVTEHSVRGRRTEVLRETAAGARLIIAVTVPLTMLMVTMGEPFIVATFTRGNFDEAGARLLGLVLAVLAVALLGEALQRVLMVPFYARLDMGTPFRNAAYGVSSNLVLIAGVFALRQRPVTALVSLAVAFTLSEYVGPVHAWLRIRASVGPLPISILRRLLAHLPAVAVGSAVCVSLRVILGLDAPMPRVDLLALTSLVSASGLAAYCLVWWGTDPRARGSVARVWHRSPPPQPAVTPAGAHGQEPG